MTTTRAALAFPIRGANLIDIDHRHGPRQPCQVEATSRLLEPADGLSWGARITDVSTGGLKLELCFPFRPGTFLGLDVETPRARLGRTLVCRVLHVHDHANGTWTLGCALLQPLSNSELALLR